MRKVIIFAMAGVLMGAGVAGADDFSPPEWDRNDPYAMTAEWEFTSDINPVSPDGESGITNLANGGGHITQATISGPPWGGESPIWQPGDGDGEWYFPEGGLITIEMDNVIDFMPYNDLWGQITYRNPMGLLVAPTVLDITAFDNEVGSNVAATFQYSQGSYGPGTTEYYAAMWRLSPNPDWETIIIEVPITMTVDQIVVDTISVPEPATLLLLSLGGLLLRRRK